MLIRQPDMINHDLLVRPHPIDNLARLPIPENHISTTRTTRNVLAVRTESNVASVSGDSVTCEPLLLGLLERAVGGVDQDLVVERLTRKVFVYNQRTYLMDESK